MAHMIAIGIIERFDAEEKMRELGMSLASERVLALFR
jgi:hypothetical protein